MHAAQGRWEEARDNLEQALDFVTETGGKPAFSHGIATQAYGQRGETRAARERLEEALGVFRRMHVLPYAERAERALLDLGQGG